MNWSGRAVGVELRDPCRGERQGGEHRDTDADEDGRFIGEWREDEAQRDHGPQVVDEAGPQYALPEVKSPQKISVPRRSPRRSVEKIDTKEGWSNPAADEASTSGYPQELEDFYGCAASNRPPQSDSGLAADCMATIYSAYLSADKKGAEVEVKRLG